AVCLPRKGGVSGQATERSPETKSRAFHSIALRRTPRHSRLASAANDMYRHPTLVRFLQRDPDSPQRPELTLETELSALRLRTFFHSLRLACEAVPRFPGSICECRWEDGTTSFQKSCYFRVTRKPPFSPRCVHSLMLGPCFRSNCKKPAGHIGEHLG